MLKVYDLLTLHLVHIDEIDGGFPWCRYDVHEVADVRSVDHLPMPVEPHKVLRFELAVVLVLVQEEPRGNDVQQDILLSLKVNFALHLTQILIHSVRAPL